MKLLAIDANSIINRAFYGIRPLSTKDGVYTNGIYGFMNILLKLKDEIQPDVIAAAFDLKAPTFRHKMYSEYKAGRKPMPDELRMQIPILKDLLRRFGCVVYEKEGFEADDILGTLAEMTDKSGDCCIIATGDRDSLQLVSDNVQVWLTATKSGKPEVTVYDTAKIMEDYGVTPPEMIEIKALQGDSSDNIPGVAGVGPKTAGMLISKFHSVDSLYEQLDTADIKDNLRQKLISGRDNAYLSRTLGTICRTAPIEYPSNHPVDESMNKPELKSMLIRLEMFKLIDRLALGDEAAQTAPLPSIGKEVKIIFDAEKIPDGAVVAYDCAHRAIAAKYNGEYYIFPNDSRLLSSAGIITHDCKSLYHTLEIDFKPDIAMDTMLAAYLIAPDQSDYSTERYAAALGVSHIEGNDYSDVIFELDAIEAMNDDFKAEIEKNNQQKLLCEIEIPLAYTLYNMERVGFLVDREGIERFGEKLAVRANELQQKIYDIIGYEFNLNSPKQLGVALFEKLGLPHSKKTKTGYSTGAEVLESLRYESDAVEYLLEYRSVAKLKSTYCDGLLKVIADDGRIHSTLKQTETRTGRISSAEPNLQNIPVRTQLGREMRKFFIAKPGYALVDADYSQIELRVLASIANDDTMCAAFENGDDIHAITASQVFGMPLDMVTPDMRSKAKAVNFGIVYGISAFSLSKDIDVPVASAKKYIESYLSTYHGVREYLENTVKQAKKDGYVTTAFGRRRYLPELNSSNFNMRSFGERVAKNMPIQGTAADIIKIAMIRVDDRLRKENLKSRLIMQVHDELICETPADETERVAEIVKQEMQAAADFRVTLTADVKSAESWYDAK